MRPSWLTLCFRGPLWVLQFFLSSSTRFPKLQGDGPDGDLQLGLSPSNIWPWVSVSVDNWFSNHQSQPQVTDSSMKVSVWLHVYTCVYTCVCMCMHVSCVHMCVCVCVWQWEGHLATYRQYYHYQKQKNAFQNLPSMNNNYLPVIILVLEVIIIITILLPFLSVFISV